METVFLWLEGNVSRIDWGVTELGNHEDLIQAVNILASGNAADLNDINVTLSSDIDAIALVIDRLGIEVGDTDYDGLSGLEELEVGTNPLCSDTDCDNLNDAYEIKVGTDPTEPVSF